MTVLLYDTLTAHLQQLKEEPVLYLIAILFSFDYSVIHIVSEKSNGKVRRSLHPKVFAGILQI